MRTWGVWTNRSVAKRFAALTAPIKGEPPLPPRRVRYQSWRPNFPVRHEYQRLSKVEFPPYCRVPSWPRSATLSVLRKTEAWALTFAAARMSRFSSSLQPEPARLTVHRDTVIAQESNYLVVAVLGSARYLVESCRLCYKQADNLEVRWPAMQDCRSDRPTSLAAISLLPTLAVARAKSGVELS